MNRTVDAILFDFGGVYTASPFGAIESASEELGARPGQLLEIVFGPYHEDTDHPWHRLERGEISLVEAREAIIELGARQSLETDPFVMLARMAGKGGIREAMVERTRTLRTDGYQTALVTNNAKEFRQGWRSMLPLDQLFSVVVDSSEVGFRKPDPEIFHHTLELLGGVAPTRTVFLDDYPGNIAAAERLGMQTVLVDDPDRAISELDAALAR